MKSPKRVLHSVMRYQRWTSARRAIVLCAVVITIFGPTGLTHAQPTAEGEQSGTSVVRMWPGETMLFGIRANSGGDAADAPLRGAEWYLNGRFVGATYVSGEPRQATLEREISFPSTGPQRIAALAFDRAGKYRKPVSWTIDVRARPRVLRVDHADELLGEVERTSLAGFLQEQGFTAVALYRLPQILPSRASELSTFIALLHARGIDTVFAAIGGTAGLIRVGDYQSSAATSARFDGLVTELEFWQPPYDYRGYLHLLDDARQLADKHGLP